MKKFPDIDEFIKGKNVVIEKGVKLMGGKIILQDNIVIRNGTQIDVTETLDIGKNSIIGEKNIIKGRKIKLGREFYSNHHAEIGGGSCFEKTSKLTIGYWFHFGSYTIINTAMEVKIGNNVGMGRFTNVYTHGAYQSVLEGYPISFNPIYIGDNVWMPGATVNPNITIGNYVVIGVGSIVNTNIPTGCFAAGIPCRVIREHCYPQKLTFQKKCDIINNINKTWDLDLKYKKELLYLINKATIDFDRMTIKGKVTKKSERARNILRRHGIRFKVENINGEYSYWKE